jgi:hypothetical protein
MGTRPSRFIILVIDNSVTVVAVVSWPDHQLAENDPTQIKRNPPVQQSRETKRQSASRLACYARDQLVLTKRKKSGIRVSNGGGKQDDGTDVMVITMRAVLVRLFILVDILPERFLALSA